MIKQSCEDGSSRRLAIVLSHPVQYYSPWFAALAQEPTLTLKVFYLWNFGVTEKVDPSFGVLVKWDIPLLEGYDHEFVPNTSSDPGTHHFNGLQNPTLPQRLQEWQPDAILLFGYAYRTHLQLLLSPRLKSIPVLMRGDSHNLGRRRTVKNQLAQWSRYLMFKRFSAFLAVGNANADYYRASGVPSHKIFIAPHCVDNERFMTSASEALLGSRIK